MADDQTINDVYRLDIDQSALNRLKSGVAAGRKAIADMTAQVKSQPAAFDGAAKAAANYAKAVVDSEKKIADAKKTAALVTAKESSTGSAQKLFSTGAQIAGGLGGGPIGQAISTAGGVTDAIRELPKLKEAFAGLSPTAIAAGVGVAGLTIALDLYSQAQEKAKQVALSEIASREQALALIQTGSKAEIQTRIDQLTKTKTLNENAAKDTEKLFQDLRSNISKNLGPGALAIQDAAAVVGKAAGEFQGAKQASEDANKALSATSTELSILEQQSGLTARSIDDATKALQNAAYITGDIQNRVSGAQEAYNVVLSGTSDSLAKRKNDLQNFITINESAATEAHNRLATEKLSIEEQKALSDSIDNLTKSSNAYKTTLAFLSDTFVSSTIAAREAAAFVKKQDEEKIAAIKVFNEAEKKAIQDNNKAKGEALDRLNEAQVKAAEAAAEAAEKALQSLIDKKNDLAQDLSDSFIDDEIKRQREEIDAKIKLAQEETRAARDHATEMRGIQAKSKRDEKKLLDDRDFVALFELRQQTQDELKEKQDTYIQSRQDANEDAEIAAKDRATASQREREDRLTQYARNLRDAQAQYNREIQAAATSKTQQLQLAQQAYQATINQLASKLNTEQRLNQAALDTALRYAATGAQARVDIEAKTQAALLQLANNRLSAIQNSSSGTTTNGRIVTGATDTTRLYGGQIAVARAGGGGVNQGQVFNYNEKPGQRESFNGALLPAGAGTAYAARSGYVNPNGGGKSLTVNGPLVAPTIQTGASGPQLQSLEQAIFDGTVKAVHSIFGSE